MTTLRTTLRFHRPTEIIIDDASALVETVEGDARLVKWGGKGARKLVVGGPALVATTDTGVVDSLTASWRAVSAKIESVEEIESRVAPAPALATDPQRRYLRKLGFVGAFGEMTKAEASALIDSYKRLSAADNDTFDGPQHTW